MSAIGKWLVQVLLGWLLDALKDWYEQYQNKKRIERERKEANEAAAKKLEEAKSEQEVVDAGSDLLSR